MKQARSTLMAIAPLVLLCVLLLPGLLGGCQRYELAMTLDDQGGGERDITVAIDGRDVDLANMAPEDVAPDKLSLDLARRLLGLTEARGWRITGTDEQPGDDAEIHLARRSRVGAAADWSAHSDDLLIRVAPDSPIVMHNLVSVDIARDPEGHRLTYRETFYWQGLKAEIIAFQARAYVATVSGAFPGLTGEDRAEIRGLVSASLDLSWDRLLASDDTYLQTVVIPALTEQTAGVIRRRDAAADVADLATLVGEGMQEPDDMERYLQEDLPGLLLASRTSVKLSVTLPGPVTDANADEIQGNTATWDLDLGDTVARPLEVHATTLLEDD